MTGFSDPVCFLGPFGLRSLLTSEGKRFTQLHTFASWTGRDVCAFSGPLSWRRAGPLKRGWNGNPTGGTWWVPALDWIIDGTHTWAIGFMCWNPTSVWLFSSQTKRWSNYSETRVEILNIYACIMALLSRRKHFYSWWCNNGLNVNEESFQGFFRVNVVGKQIMSVDAIIILCKRIYWHYINHTSR